MWAAGINSVFLGTVPPTQRGEVPRTTRLSLVYSQGAPSAIEGGGRGNVNLTGMIC